MDEQVRAEIIALGALAGAILSIIGVIKAINSIKNAVREWRRKRRERKTAPIRKLMEQMDALTRSTETITKRLERMDETDKAIKDKLSGIDEKLKDTEESIATLQGDRLNQAFEHYVEGGRPCPMAVKASLTVMCEQYLRKGHNHLHANYMERLEQCPTK